MVLSNDEGSWSAVIFLKRKTNPFTSARFLKKKILKQL